jgi:hypothetical protein
LLESAVKKCPYCGRENAVGEFVCHECGTELDTAEPEPVTEETVPWHKVAVLENEVVADRLDVELNSQGIPHVMVSYHDTALDGLFQTLRGWGHVEAPDEARSRILSILKEIIHESEGPLENRG